MTFEKKHYLQIAICTILSIICIFIYAWYWRNYIKPESFTIGDPTQSLAYEKLPIKEYISNDEVLFSMDVSDISFKVNNGRANYTYNFEPINFNGVNNDYSLFVNNVMLTDTQNAGLISGVHKIDFINIQNEVFNTIDVNVDFTFQSKASMLNVSFDASGDNVGLMMNYLNKNNLIITITENPFDIGSVTPVGPDVNVVKTYVNNTLYSTTRVQKGQKATIDMLSIKSYYYVQEISANNTNLDALVDSIELQVEDDVDINITAIRAGSYYGAGDAPYDSENFDTSFKALLNSNKISMVNGVVSNAQNLSCRRLVLPSIVTEIADDAFYQNSTMTAIVIPSSVKNIGARAFNSCLDLSHVEIHSQELTLGNNAFYNLNSRLDKVVIDTSSVYKQLNKIDGLSGAKTIKILKTVDDSSNKTLNNGVNYINYIEGDYWVYETLQVLKNVTALGNKMSSQYMFNNTITLEEEVSVTGLKTTDIFNMVFRIQFTKNNIRYTTCNKGIKNVTELDYNKDSEYFCASSKRDIHAYAVDGTELFTIKITCPRDGVLRVSIIGLDLEGNDIINSLYVNALYTYEE